MSVPFLVMLLRAGFQANRVSIEKWCQSTAPIEGALEGPERDEVVWPTDTDLFDDEEYFADEE